MQLQFNKSAIRCLGTAALEVQNAEVTQEQRLSDGMPDIGRVLTTWGQTIIRSKQWHGNTVELTGGVMTWTLYAPEDGTEPRSVESWIPFHLKWEVRDVDREGPMRMIPHLRFADSRSISARKLMVRAGISAMAQAMYPKDAETYAPGELPEDVQLLKNTYLLRLPVESGEKTFQMDEEVALPNSDTPAERLLCVTAHPEVTEKRVLSDKVVFKGQLKLRIICRDQEGKVHSLLLPLAFSQLSELDHSYGADAQADIQMAVTSLETDLSDEMKLRVKCGLVAQYLIDDRHVLELVQDAYSPQREVTPEMEALELPGILEDRVDTVTAEQTVPGQTGQIVDSAFYADFPGIRQSGNGIDLDLNGVFQTLLYDENETLQSISSRWEGKMYLNADENSIPMITQDSGTVQSAASVDGLSLSAQMPLRIRTCSREEIPMVTGLELGQIQEPDLGRPSVILCAPDGESLWELAKKNGSTVSAIRLANGIEDEISGNRMLLIPVL